MLVGLGFGVPAYFVFLLTSIVVFAVLAASVGLLTGRAGMITLCQMSFAGVGAWTVGYLGVAMPAFPLPLAIVAGALATVPVGVLVGLPALRLRGLNFAIVTLGFATVCDVALSAIDFGGAAGAAVVRTGMLGNDRVYYCFCVGAFVVVAGALTFANRFRFASAWTALESSERATAAFGRNVALSKLTAIAISAGIAGLAGGLMAGQLGILSPRNFSPVASLVLFATAVMAGARYPIGALIAGVLFVAVPELLVRAHLPADLANIAFAAGTIGALLNGGGIADSIVRRRPRRATMSDATERTAAAAVPSLPRANGVPANPAQGVAVLELRDLTVTYGSVVALDRVNLIVAPRSRVGIIGPNGAGKSTLIDAVSGFVAYSGSVTLGGRTIDAERPARRARSGLRRSFQNDRTIGDLSISAYLELCAGRSLSRAELADARDFAHTTALLERLEDLDAGTRRLLEVAGLLAARPHVALLDEPAAGLSYEDSLVLGNRIAGIPERYGCAVVLIEHDMDLMRRACERALVLDFGKPIAFGKTEDVLARPDVVAAYLGDADVAS